MRRRLVSCLPLAAVIALASRRPAVAQDGGGGGQLAALRATLSAPATPAAGRDEAARRLVGLNTPRGWELVRSLLSGGPPATQVAVARAVAGAESPDPAVAADLAKLLGPNLLLTEAAAGALAGAQNPAEAFGTLRRFADDRQNPAASRSAAVRVMGGIVRRDVAAYLVSALNAPETRAAAATALADLTGLPQDPDPARWQRWWQPVLSQPDDAFRAGLAQQIARRAALLRLSQSTLQASAETLLKSQYYLKIPDDKKSETLLSYLKSPAPSIRAMGVNLVGDEFGYHRVFVTEPLLKELRAMISDSDPNVRLQVAGAYFVRIKDSVPTDAIISQLGQETDPAVKAMLTKVLTNSDDPRAIDALLTLLDDPSTDEQVYAARAMAADQLGKSVRARDPALADRASAVLRKKLGAIANRSGTDALRTAVMAALATLADPASADTFLTFIRQPGEVAAVREYAIRGLARIKADDASDTIAKELDPTGVPTTRLEAAVALQTVAQPYQAIDLFGRLRGEKDPDVKAALWVAFRNLFPALSVNDLTGWANQWLNSNEPQFYLETEQALLGKELKRQEADGGGRPGQESEAVAATNENIGLALMKLGRPEEAIRPLQAALDYWAGQGAAGQQQVESLIGEVLKADLAARRYADAVAFAGRKLGEKDGQQFEHTVGPLFTGEADRLAHVANDPKAATQLIDAATKMEPPLAGKYLNTLEEIRQGLPKS